MRLFRRKERRDRRPEQLPAAVRRVVSDAGAGAVLAHAQDEDVREWVLVTATRLMAVSAGEQPRITLDRAWSDVDKGKWVSDNDVLTVTFVHGKPRDWHLDRFGAVPEVFHERVQASVVTAEHLDTAGGSVRVVLRKDLATHEMHEQVLLGRKADAEHPALVAAVAAARRRVREQVGADAPAVEAPLAGRGEEADDSPESP